MVKKYWVLTIVALLVGAVLVPAAFAEKNDHAGSWYDQMFNWHSQQLDAAVENGQVSEQQADAWRQHFNYMREFHREYPMGYCGGYYGGGYNNSGNGNDNKSAGYGGRMMGGPGMHGYAGQ